MPLNMAPYETSITAGFTALGEIFGFLEKLSPEIQQWIQDKIPLQQQRIMDRRIRRCVRICRRRKYNGTLIMIRVAEDFKDLQPADRINIIALIKAQLGVTT